MNAIMKWVGEVYWPWPQDHIEETALRGPSIRIAPDSVPDLKTPYPVFFIHPRGTFTVDGALFDLLGDLIGEGHIKNEGYREDGDWNVLDDYIDPETGLPKLAFVGVFRELDRYNKAEFERVVKKYGVEFAPAATHYSYITSTQVVMDSEGNDTRGTLGRLKARGIDAEPVIINRVDDNDEEVSDEDSD